MRRINRDISIEQKELSLKQSEQETKAAARRIIARSEELAKIAGRENKLEEIMRNLTTMIDKRATAL